MLHRHAEAVALADARRPRMRLAGRDRHGDEDSRERRRSDLDGGTKHVPLLCLATAGCSRLAWKLGGATLNDIGRTAESRCLSFAGAPLGRVAGEAVLEGIARRLSAGA